MTQPTQDTDITSSISPLFHVQDDASEKLRAGKNVKKFAQGRSPASFIMDTVYSDERESGLEETAKYQGSELVKSLGETLPWIIKFSKVIQSAVGSKNPKLLDRLLFVYIENMSRDVDSCYTKPYRAAKLKTHINETLIFFHLYWRNIKERVNDHNQYLDKISQILAMYVDMELKASRRGKDSASKIAAKLLTAMFIYLDNSEEHIFRILFRVKFITKNYSHICAPVFKKLFAGISGRVKRLTDVTYVRYLLALKLWKRIKDDLQEKKKINELAVAIIGQRTPSMNHELLKIIPKPSECHKNGTLWLLKPNSFDLRKACDGFIKYELNERIISLPESIERLKIVDSVEVPLTQTSLESIDRLKDVQQEDKSLDRGQQAKKMVKLRRFKPSFPKLRPGEVVFIDLTAENEEKKQGDGKKKKKKDKKKLKWLKEVSKRSKLKKEHLKKTWIEKADAHSTEDNNTDVILKRTANNWPISEDKVTESTERIQSRFGKRPTKLGADIRGANKQEKKKCDTMCKGCKFCSLIGKLKYTTNERQGKIESSENLVTSQTSLLNNDAMVLIKGPFIDKEFYEAESHEDFLNRLKQDPKPTEMIKKEPQDIIDDSTTDKNCDKIIINDSSSFNITKKNEEEEHFNKRNLFSTLVKLKAGDTTAEKASIPSTSSGKNFIHSSAGHGKLFKVKECINETCVVSTTDSIVDFNSEEQINVVSGSTIETMKANYNLDNNPGSLKKEGGKKSFANSKSHKSAEMSKKNSSSDLVNDKLQHSLIHALSLDEIIQIGRDDVDSESEDDGDKVYSSKTIQQRSSKIYRTKFAPDNDFFQMPDIQLCDDLTNDNDVETLVTAGGKNKVDEFENIDILDSILNGDMSMQDILEEQQHLSMNSTSNETSTNMLGFFTEFFKQSEVTLTDTKDSAAEEASNLDGISKSLPEGSLGMTGILNSLLDSDLTSIDSPPSDFMYSNVQTVDPRLIRKSPTAERAAFLSDFSSVSDVFSPKELSSGENFTALDSISKKTKDQLFLDEKDTLNCTDLEEFGLSSSRETAFEIPSLEEELIQLPQHPLIDETIITQISPSTCESPLPSARSEIVNLNDVQLPETSNYNYHKLGNFQEFTSLRLKDIIQQSSNEIDHGEDLPTSTLTDFTPPQSVDPPKSPYTFTSSPAHSQTVPHSPTHSMGISRNTISANMLTPPPSVAQFIQQNNLTPPTTPQQNQNQNQIQNHEARSVGGNLLKNRINRLSIIPDDYSQQQDPISKSLRRGEVFKMVRNSKNNAKLKTLSAEIEDEIIIDADKQQAARLAHVQVALTRLTREEINGRAGSGEQSVLKNRILIKRKADELKSPQLQRIDLREFSIAAAAQQNKSVLINLNGKTKPALVLERNVQSNDDDKKSLSQDTVNSRSSNILYKLTSKVKPPATSKDKPYSKLPKVNFTIQNEMDIVVKTKSSSITRCGNNKGLSKDNNQTIIRPRCSTRRVVKTQAIKTAKEMNVRKTMNVPIAEEPSMKKRKIHTKFLPLLENEGIIYAVNNQQKTQEKHSNVIRRDFARKDRTKKKVV